jgi:hypothetical protein
LEDPAVADTADLHIDMGESSFSVMKPVSADFFSDDGRPALSASRDRLAPAPTSAPAAEPASEPPAIDLDAPVKEMESRLAQLQEQPATRRKDIGTDNG